MTNPGTGEPVTMRRDLQFCLFLTLMTVAVYAPVAGHDFLNYDDPLYVTNNPQVQRGLTWENVRWAFRSTREATNWHPLTWLSHMLDCELYGLEPRGHHLSSVLLHAANTVLLFLLLQRMTGARWRSAFVAGLFALHPLHVESVAWVAERKDVLSGLFWFLTMWAYVRYVEQPRPVWYFLSLGLFGLGLMAKPMLVTLPFVLLLADFWPLGRAGAVAAGREPQPQFQPATLRRLLVEKLPFLVFAAVASLVTFLVQGAGGAVIPPEQYSLSLRIANAVVSYVRYIGKMIWPADLAIYYPYPVQWPVGLVIGCALLLVGATALAVRRMRREPYLAFGWLWYLGTLVPVIGLVQVGTQSMADRFTYIPLTGLFLVIAWSAHELAMNRMIGRIIFRATTGIVLTILAISTSLQLRHWKNSLTVFEHALQVSSENVVAHNNLGAALLELGNLDDAVVHYREAVRIRPHYPDVHNNLGIALQRRGRVEEAVVHFTEAIRLRPQYADAHSNLGAALAEQGKIEDAIVRYTEALRLNSGHIVARNNLAQALVKAGKLNEAVHQYSELLRLKPDHFQAHKNLADLLARLGRAEEAIAHYVRAIELKPDSAEAHHNLGIVMANLGEYAAASERFRAALRHKPDSAVTHYALAGVLARLGRAADAIAQYREALRLKPDWPEALRELAWILATHPEAQFRNGPEAVRLAEQACALSNHQQPRAVQSLAAAYAEAGQYEQAVREAQKARALAQSGGQSELAGEIGQQLELYRTGRPYREVAGN
jgi:tetratricopeptide (TPR) repeat protein